MTVFHQNTPGTDTEDISSSEAKWDGTQLSKCVPRWWSWSSGKKVEELPH